MDSGDDESCMDPRDSALGSAKQIKPAQPVV